MRTFLVRCLCSVGCGLEFLTEIRGGFLKEVYGDFHVDWNENLTDDLKAEYDQGKRNPFCQSPSTKADYTLFTESDPESLDLKQQVRIPNNIEFVSRLLKGFIC